jgi:hypothetical protein
VTGPDLERMFWRWQYGRIDAQLLELRLRDAVDRAQDEEMEWNDAARVLADWNVSLRSVHVQARREALLAVDRHHFRDAVRELERCRGATATLRELLAADTDAGAAEDALDRLHDLVQPARLRALPATASLAQRVDAVRQCMLDGRYVEASLSAKLCTRIAGRLLERASPEGTQRDELRARLRNVEKLCEETQPWAPDGDDPHADGTLAALRGLLRDRHPRLVARLLTELEIDLGPRRRLLTARPLLGGHDDAAVKATVGQFSWDGAVDHYWHASIAGYAKELSLEQQRAAAADADLTHALANPERSS